MARRTSKLTKKRGKPRHRERRQYPYEDWPAFKPVPGTDGRLMELDLNELTPEQRAEWDRASAEGERLRELHERVGKKLEYRQNVRDGLLPPAWVSAPMSAVAATPLLPAAITPVPDVQQQPARYVAAPEWIAGEARRLKRANAIPASIIFKKDFAKLLEENMLQASKGDHAILIHPVKWTYIKNNLKAWGLWPISAIR